MAVALLPDPLWDSVEPFVFALAATGSGMLSVPAQGGEFVDYYKHDPKIEGDIHRPSLLPDKQTLLFVVDRVDTGADTIGVLANGTRKDILRIENETLDSPAYSPTGHILYDRETTTPGLWALPFSLERMEATGPPFLVEPQASYPSVAANGTMVFVEGSVSGLGSLAWLDIATGMVTPALKEQFPTIRFPKLSPDGSRVAAVVQSLDQGQVVIVADLQRNTHVRIADRADVVTRPTWRDDRTVIYGRAEARREDILMRNADGSGEEIKIGTGMTSRAAAGRLFFAKLSAATNGDLFQVLLPPGSPRRAPGARAATARSRVGAFALAGWDAARLLERRHRTIRGDSAHLPDADGSMASVIRRGKLRRVEPAQRRHLLSRRAGTDHARRGAQESVVGDARHPDPCCSSLEPPRACRVRYLAGRKAVADGSGSEDR